MQPPDNIQLIKGEISRLLVRQRGYIIFLVKKSNPGPLKILPKILNLVKRITHNKKVPLLIYLSKSPVPDKATRKFSTEQLPNIYTAMAMVSKPGLTKLIMNVLFKFKAPPIQ
jgi:hypothetical protein